MASLPLATTAGDQAETEFSETQKPSPNGQYPLEQKVVCFLLQCPFEIKKKAHRPDSGKNGAAAEGDSQVLSFAEGWSLSISLCRCFGQAEVDDWNQWLQAAGGCRAEGKGTRAWLKGGQLCGVEEGWVGTGAVSGCGGLMAQEEASGSHTSARQRETGCVNSYGV